MSNVLSNDFKAGDRVVCIRGNVMPSDCLNSKINKYEAYTIELPLGAYIVTLTGVQGHFCTTRFELRARA